MTADGLSVPSEAVEWVCRSIRSAGSCPAAIVRERRSRLAASADPVSGRGDVVGERQRRRGAAPAPALGDEARRPGCRAGRSPARVTTCGAGQRRCGTPRGRARWPTGSAGRPAASVAAAPLTWPDAMSCGEALVQPVERGEPAVERAGVDVADAAAEPKSTWAQLTAAPRGAHGHPHGRGPQAPASPMS